MTGTTTTLEKPHHVASTCWIPRAVRCAKCGEVAHEEVRERVDDDEVIVRYGCGSCRWHSTRHFRESEMTAHRN